MDDGVEVGVGVDEELRGSMTPSMMCMRPLFVLDNRQVSKRKFAGSLMEKNWKSTHRTFSAITFALLK